jgi:hypothetical protein
MDECRRLHSYLDKNMRWLELPNFDSTVTGRRTNGWWRQGQGQWQGRLILRPLTVSLGKRPVLALRGCAPRSNLHPQIRSDQISCTPGSSSGSSSGSPPQRAIAIAHPRCISYRKKCVLNSKIALGDVTDTAEQLDKLVISQVGLLAQRRLARGVKLNHSEACVCWLGP